MAKFDDFAAAIANRFADSDLTRLMPLATTSTTLSTTTSTSSTTTTTITATSVTPTSLSSWLNDPSTLILDIRPHAAYSSARIPGAVSLSVPSTLLKRPLFPLKRLSAMLPSQTARNRFAAWPSSARILVYDADAHTIPENSNINGLLRKFNNDGFLGELAWLKGGFQSVWREKKDLVDTGPETEANDDEDRSSSTAHLSVLRTRHLPVSAFSQSSTLLHNNNNNNTISTSFKRALPQSRNQFQLIPSVSSSNPFFDTIRQNVELSHGITERIPLRLPHRVRRRIHDLPFPWLQQIARRAGNPLSHTQPPSSSEDSPDDDIPHQADTDQGADALAMQFYRIELAEQRRLMGIMEHHSKESGQFSDAVPHLRVSFPFSITAGVEKGAKNRYRHIWPFEHARVRLHQRGASDDDYVNASYVQPLGTNKRYIATQGPLPATFVDFWTLCWEQNVHVIVMLTREVEGAMVKCGSYWTDNVFGPLRLRLISTTGTVDPSEEHSGFFSAHSTFAPIRPSTSLCNQSHQQQKHHHYHKSETIERVFELSHTGYPNAKSRTIIHLQYLEWPDMNVPDDPRGVLGLVKQVEEALKKTGVQDEPCVNVKDESLMDLDEETGIAKQALGKNSPVLLHCSAGVGRTGGFIAVDAILDSIRREIKAKKNEMDVDSILVEKKGDSHSSKTTIPPKMNHASDHEDIHPKEFGQTLFSGLVVHVPVAQEPGMQMQVDRYVPPLSETPEPEGDFATGLSTSSPFKDTKRWAEKVGEETGYGHQQEPCSHLALSKDSLEPGTSGSSSSEDSLGHLTFSSNEYQQRSSSLGTSVSGTSPVAPTTISATKFGKRKVGNMVDVSTPSALNEPRGRTVSTPLKKVPPSLHLGPQLTGSSTPSLSNVITNKRRVGSSLSTNRDRDLSPAIPSSMSGTTRSPSRSRSPCAIGCLPPETGAGSERLCSKKGGSESASSFKSFDYKDPRPLHDDCLPPSLASYTDPIWEVVQDMREQRMSLCQSLRQYVFVHAAIIEGALMVVDEEKGNNDGVRNIDTWIRNWDDLSRLSQPKTAPSILQSRSPSMTLPKSWSGSRRSSPPSSPALDKRTAFMEICPQVSEVESVSSSTGKRSASPTELLREGRQGELLLSKRPSMKRKSEDKRSVESAMYREGKMLITGRPSVRVVSMPP